MRPSSRAVSKFRPQRRRDGICGLAHRKVRRGHSKFHRSQFHDRKDRSRRLRLLLVSLGVLTGATYYAIEEVGIGGPAYERIAAAKDLLGDILPPPEYVIEAYLETNLLMNGTGDRKAHEARLAQLHKDFSDRRAYWKTSVLPDEIKTELVEGSSGEADRFWSELETVFLPAIDGGSKAAAAASFDKLTAIYTKHRMAIDDIVTKSTSLSDREEANARSKTAALSWTALSICGMMLAFILAMPSRAFASG